MWDDDGEQSRGRSSAYFGSARRRRGSESSSSTTAGSGSGATQMIMQFLHTFHRSSRSWESAAHSVQEGGSGRSCRDRMGPPCSMAETKNGEFCVEDTGRRSSCAKKTRLHKNCAKTLRRWLDKRGGVREDFARCGMTESTTNRKQHESASVGRAELGKNALIWSRVLVQVCGKAGSQFVWILCQLQTEGQQGNRILGGSGCSGTSHLKFETSWSCCRTPEIRFCRVGRRRFSG